MSNISQVYWQLFHITTPKIITKATKVAQHQPKMCFYLFYSSILTIRRTRLILAGVDAWQFFDRARNVRLTSFFLHLKDKWMYFWILDYFLLEKIPSRVKNAMVLKMPKNSQKSLFFTKKWSLKFKSWRCSKNLFIMQKHLNIWGIRNKMN